ncbi:uncharacterized protein LOC131003788 [Salvia miltiorrhiza]|uniref:uncharacterized protein LOC131003788 n=1 Tax=Salvia miltiorrhiza TaxID=226208 RepID=UPI0025AC397F|nr:uncharacterized protein LOC131003788 [Salvia miltiorrhiza]
MTAMPPSFTPPFHLHDSPLHLTSTFKFHLTSLQPSHSSSYAISPSPTNPTANSFSQSPKSFNIHYIFIFHSREAQKKSRQQRLNSIQNSLRLCGPRGLALLSQDRLCDYDLQALPIQVEQLMEWNDVERVFL